MDARKGVEQAIILLAPPPPHASSPVTSVGCLLIRSCSFLYPQVSGLSGYSKVIFRDAHDKPLMQRYRSLFPGLGFAAGYKVSQRIYKFGGQPVVKDYMTKNHSDTFKNLFGDRNAKTMMHATAGSLIGIGEIALLPLDVLKIRAQTNPDAIAGRGFVQIFQQEGLALYRGAGWTAARNAPGSFALFGGSAVCKEYLFQLDNFNDATFFQNFVSSIPLVRANVVVCVWVGVMQRDPNAC